MRRVAVALAVATVALLVTAAPAAAAPTPTATSAGVFVKVTPKTVVAGSTVTIRASCPNNANPAVVQSAAFGRVAALPNSGFLSISVTVPANTAAKSYPVDLDCPDTSQDAHATLVIVSASAASTPSAASAPTRGPATGFGGTAGGDDGTAAIALGLLALVAGLTLGVVALRRRAA